MHPVTFRAPGDLSCTQWPLVHLVPSRAPGDLFFLRSMFEPREEDNSFYTLFFVLLEAGSKATK